MPKGKKKDKRLDFFAKGKVLAVFAEHAEASPEAQAAVAEDVVEQVDEVGSALANLMAALGMAGGTPVEIINAAIAALTASPDEGEGDEAAAEEVAASRKAMATIAKAVALKADATPAEIAKKVDVMVLGGVSSETYSKTRERLDTLEARQRKQDAEILVESFVKSRQLNPNDKDKMQLALTRAEADPTAFSETMELVPTVVPAEGSMGDANEVHTQRTEVISLTNKQFSEIVKSNPTLKRAPMVNRALVAEGFDTLTQAEADKLGKEGS